MTNSLSHAMKMTLEKGYVCMNHCDRFKPSRLTSARKTAASSPVPTANSKSVQTAMDQNTRAKPVQSTNSVFRTSTAKPKCRPTKPTSLVRWSKPKRPATTRNATVGITSAAVVWSTGLGKAVPTLRAKKLTCQVAGIVLGILRASALLETVGNRLERCRRGLRSRLLGD